MSELAAERLIYGIWVLSAMIKEHIAGTFAFESVNLCQTKCELALDLWKLPQMYIYNFKKTETRN